MAILERLKTTLPYRGQPTFFYIHLMSVHRLSVMDPAYDIFSSSNVSENDLITDRYDNSIGQTDAYLESIFSILDRKGYLESSLVVITSDHGEILGNEKHLVQSFSSLPVSPSTHGHALYQDETRKFTKS